MCGPLGPGPLPLTGLWRIEGRKVSPPLGCDLFPSFQVGTLFRPSVWRLIRPQEAFLGSLGTWPGLETYGADNNLTPQDKEPFQGL